MNTTRKAAEAELEELVSHVLALRKDFIQRLLRSRAIPFSGLRKPELRERLLDALHDGEISPEEVAQYLDEVEPGGKQHVFLMRARAPFNERWLDPATVRRRLRTRAEATAAGRPAPLLMPPELLPVCGSPYALIEVTAVEARRYTEAGPGVRQGDDQRRGAQGRTARLHRTRRAQHHCPALETDDRDVPPCM